LAIDVSDAADPVQALDDVPHSGGDPRSVGLDRSLALHQDLLAGLLGEARGLHDHVAALGLAVAGGRLVEIVLTDLAADEDGQDDEDDPAHDSGLAVVGTPSTGARCKVP